MMKWEFEDLALRYLEPEVYYDLVERVVLKRKEREGCIEEAKNILRGSGEHRDIWRYRETQAFPRHIQEDVKPGQGVL